jgi:hypothetical protein
MPTKNRELFTKDPLSWTLANQGVSSNNDTDLDTLKYELETFVCDGEYKTGLSRILQSYLSNFDKDDQAGAWVSGFYGSGKSHLVKVLRYLWTDFAFPDSSTARGLTTLPSEITDLLKELTTRGLQSGGLHSAGGTLKAGKGDVRARVLGIVFMSVGLPEDVSLARLHLDLRKEGLLDQIREKITAAGAKPDEEFNRIYTSKSFLQAYLETHPQLGTTQEASKALQAQYRPNSSEVSINDMLSLIQQALEKDGQLPCTLIVLDEVQQFINNDAKISNDVQEVAEAILKGCDGRILLVCTGQSALSDTPALQRLAGRFTVKSHLKDNDVEKVVRTVVLQKKPEKKKELQDLISKYEGEISRQLKSTKIATRTEDHEDYVPDYPLLPVRRRFWERVLHSLDPTGTAAQMRTQLRVTHDACRAIADKPLGTIITGDFLYEQIATDLIMSAVLPSRFHAIIEAQKKEQDGELRSRICSLVFLINKLPRQQGDEGVRANAEHIADLLTGDLHQSCAEIRKKVPDLLTALAEEAVLMVVDGEYRLQTSEGADWEGEYKRHSASIRNNDATIAASRAQILTKKIQDELGSLSIAQGAAKERRKVTLHYGSDVPGINDGLTVWVRDGFREDEGSVIKEIQGRSTDDPLTHVLIPKTKSDALKDALASSLAAEQTLHAKGIPTTPEGTEARTSMQSRLALENAKVDQLMQEVLRGSQVFLSGGAEQPMISLRETVQAACEGSLANLYPKFSAADSSSWGTVWKKAKEGNAGALTAVSYSGDPDKHPVASEILRFIGSGKKGGDVVATFTGAPYGWPKDAVDACIAVLLQSGHLAARLNSQPAGLSELDQRKIAQADYRLQNPVLTASQKLRVRKLYGAISLVFTPGEEEIAAPRFLEALRTLASSAGGEAPVPETPRPPLLADLSGKHGNDLLFELFGQADALEKLIKEWQETAKKIASRLPEFQMAEDLLAQAERSALPIAADQRTAIEAIKSHRSLLDDPDPIQPIRKSLGAALRSSLTEAHEAYESTRQSEIQKLEAQSVWSSLKAEKRTALLQAGGVSGLAAPLVGTDAELLSALRQCDQSSYRNQTDALPTRCGQALSAAIKEAAPKARQVTLPRAQISSEAELDVWLEAARKEIQKALKDGPAII